MLDFKIAVGIVSLIVIIGLFLYNPIVYHAKLLKLRKEVEDLRKTVKTLALYVELQTLISKIHISVETEEITKEPEKQSED